MKRTVKISASIEGVLPTAPYANQRPGFLVEITMPETDWTDDQIFEYQRTLQDRCYQQLKDAESKAIRERIDQERKDFRWYKNNSGRLIPSVTSILSFDADFFCEVQHLRECAAQGILTHKAVSHYLRYKKWLTAFEITEAFPELFVELVILKKGASCLETPDSLDFPGFLEKYPVEAKGIDVEVINEADEYGGTLDFYGTPAANPKEDIKNVLTCYDVKRTVDKTKNFMQIAAYSKALEKQGTKIEQMMIIPLQPGKTQQGWSKPVVSSEIEKYYSLFLEKRRQFRVRYGI